MEKVACGKKASPIPKEKIILDNGKPALVVDQAGNILMLYLPDLLPDPMIVR